MVGLVPYQQLGVPAPMAVAVDAARVKAVGTSWQPLLDLMPFIVKLGAIMGLSSTIIVQMMAQPRVFFAMSRDGLLPAWASRIHPRFRTPHLTTLLTGAIVIVASGFTSIGVLGELVSIGTLFAFVIVSIGVIVLRRTRPDLERPFKAPFVPALPIASAVVSFLLMLALPWSTWERLIVWMVLGLVIYFAYGRTHSKLRAAGGLKPFGTHRHDLGRDAAPYAPGTRSIRSSERPASATRVRDRDRASRRAATCGDCTHL